MSKRIIALFTVIILAGLLMPHQLYALPEIKPGFPRLANYFLHWTISDEEAQELSKFDLVILDAEVQNRSRTQLEMIRKLHPTIILLAYIPASEVRSDALDLKEIAPLRYKLAQRIPEGWYLKDASGGRRAFWPGNWIVNVSKEAPRVIPLTRSALGGPPSPLGRGEGEGIWNEYLPQFVTQEILSTGLWDGILYDNAWDDIIHFARGVPDINGDGTPDDPAEAQRAWQEGLRTLYQTTIALAPDKLVFENDGPIYAPSVHGVLLENFPRKGWARHREALRQVRTVAKDPAVAILNATTFNTGRRDDYRAMRFGLATALLSDAFYSFDFGDQDHGQTWFYDEYGVFLGEPVGPSPYPPRGLRPLGPSSTPAGEGGRRPGEGIWRRNFEKGIVLVNPTDVAQSVKLPIEVEKIHGTQDTSVNDGTVTRALTIGAQDGLIVLRPLQTISGAPFENGVFARVFSAQGATPVGGQGSAFGGKLSFSQTRAGFFAFDRAEKSGTVTARVDLDGDHQDERVSIDGDGNVIIQFADGRKNKFSAFGAPWKGEVSVAVGDMQGDGLREVIVGSGVGGGEVRIFRSNGALFTLPLFPFGAQYRGGVNVAAGDVNGDGVSEIVIGAGAGGGPQVRIFSGRGKLLSGGFFAYDPRFRGGVNVAVGDLDGDGRAEIVTGPGPGGGPQVRIFDNKGRAIGSGFFAFDISSRGGVKPIVTDIDGDGKNEIVAVTKENL